MQENLKVRFVECVKEIPGVGEKRPPFHFVNFASALLPTFNCCNVFNLMPVSSLVGILLIRCGTVKSLVKSCFIDRANGKKSNPVKSCFKERESEMGGNVILVVGRGARRGDVLDKTSGNVNCRDTAGICGGWLKSMVASLYYSTLPVSAKNYSNYFCSE